MPSKDENDHPEPSGSFVLKLPLDIRLLIQAIVQFFLLNKHQRRRPVLLVTGGIAMLATIAMLLCMAPGASGGSQNDGSAPRVPPRWGPGMPNYSFRTWVLELMLWVQLTDLPPQQQVAAVLLRLDGVAKQMGRALSPD